jgi:hypothetical protein
MTVMKTLFLLLAAAAAGCSGAQPAGPPIPGRPITGEPHRGDETLILYLGNESWERPRIDLEIKVDGAAVYRDTLERGKGLVEPPPGKQEVRLALPPGQHSIQAKTLRGQAYFSTTFTLTGKEWASLAYWYNPDPRGIGPIPPGFSFTTRAEPIRFH